LTASWQRNQPVGFPYEPVDTLPELTTSSTTSSLTRDDIAEFEDAMEALRTPITRSRWSSAPISGAVTGWAYYASGKDRWGRFGRSARAAVRSPGVPDPHMSVRFHTAFENRGPPLLLRVE
jgi:hypothetical protein